MECKIAHCRHIAIVLRFFYDSVLMGETLAKLSDASFLDRTAYACILQVTFGELARVEYPVVVSPLARFAKTVCHQEDMDEAYFMMRHDPRAVLILRP